MKRLFALLLLISLLIWPGAGCDERFLERPNINNINESTFFKNVGQLSQAVNGVYAGLQRTGLFNLTYQYVHTFNADEVEPTHNTVQYGPDEVRLLNWNFFPTYGKFSDYWTDNYTVIARANLVISKADGITPADDAEAGRLARLVAEARFLRAFAYFNIATDFGQGPLRLRLTDAVELPGVPAADLYAQVENDLLAAGRDLRKRSELPAGERSRVSLGAAQALLGKLYLYQRKWAQAALALKAVIDSGEYALVPAYGDNFTEAGENNRESLFEVQFASGLYDTGASWAPDATTGWGGNTETQLFTGNLGPDSHGNYNAKPSRKLIGAFEPGDPRRDAIVFGPTTPYFLLPMRGSRPEPDYDPGHTFRRVFDRVGYCIHKWNNADLTRVNNDESNGTNGGLNMRVIRLADVYLMYAETQLELGHLAEAADWINRVRRRADPSGRILPDVAASSAAAVRAALIHERQIELAFEWSRRRDIIRWGLGPSEFDGFKVGKHEVFPIPQHELDANRRMRQNANY